MQPQEVGVVRPGVPRAFAGLPGPLTLHHVRTCDRSLTQRFSEACSVDAGRGVTVTEAVDDGSSEDSETGLSGPMRSALEGGATMEELYVWFGFRISSGAFSALFFQHLSPATLAQRPGASSSSGLTLSGYQSFCELYQCLASLVDAFCVFQSPDSRGAAIGLARFGTLVDSSGPALPDDDPSVAKAFPFLRCCPEGTLFGFFAVPMHLMVRFLQLNETFFAAFDMLERLQSCCDFFSLLWRDLVLDDAHALSADLMRALGGARSYVVAWADQMPIGLNADQVDSHLRIELGTVFAGLGRESRLLRLLHSGSSFGRLREVANLFALPPPRLVLSPHFLGDDVESDESDDGEEGELLQFGGPVPVMAVSKEDIAMLRDEVD